MVFYPIAGGGGSSPLWRLYKGTKMAFNDQKYACIFVFLENRAKWSEAGLVKGHTFLLFFVHPSLTLLNKFLAHRFVCQLDHILLMTEESLKHGLAIKLMPGQLLSSKHLALCWKVDHFVEQQL